MKWELKCSICREKKDDHFVRLSKKKGAFGWADVCMSCFKEILKDETTSELV